MNKKLDLDTISLFSGAGGLDLGLKQAGFNIIWANDILSSAVENYRHNVGDIINKDIREIKNSELPHADVIVGGFPCQPFSTAGKRLGFSDDRGNLYLEIIRLIEYKNPKVVIFENVRGILSMKNKDGSKFFDSVIKLLKNAGNGYDINYQLIKASDYGVPQNRYRVIIVGFRKDLKINYTFPAPTTLLDKSHLTLRNILDIEDGTPNKLDVWPLSPQSRHLVKFIPEGKSWKSVPYNELPDRLKKIRDNMKKYHSPNFYRRFSRDEIAGTITAAATPENSGIIHPTEDRRFSVREIARIQTFPDSYHFIGKSIPSMYKIIGNAVPPLLGKIIGESIIKTLKENNIVN